MKWIKRLTMVMLVLLVAALAAIAIYFIRDAGVPASAPLPQVAVPRFEPVALDFVHRHDGDHALPFLGSAVIDIDGDGREEVFLGGGVDQPDSLFRFDGEGFVDLGDLGLVKDPGEATYGALSLDVDADGAVDLFVTRNSGLSLYRNRGGRFERSIIETGLDTASVGLSLAATDLDLDGIVDLFLAAYLRPEHVQGLTIFNDPEYGAKSLLLHGRPDGTFENITANAGLAYTHNTFDAVFADADGDRRPDLIVAYDTGQVGTWQNVSIAPAEGPRFVRATNPTSGVFAYPMGIAVGDADGDGLTDFFFSNTGTSVPTMLVRGDLGNEQILETRWLFLKSHGDFSFTDIAAQREVSDYEFGWGAVLEDFNLDGRQDLVVAEGYIDFPPHRIFKLPGRFLLQNPDGRFAPVGTTAGTTNKAFGIAPLVADFDGDGYPDLIHVNLGGPAMALLNQGGDATWLKVVLPDATRSLGARIQVTTDDDRMLVHEMIAGEGLASDQTHVVFFGLGTAKALAVEVTFPNGDRVRVDDPEVSTTVRFDPPSAVHESDPIDEERAPQPSA